MFYCVGTDVEFRVRGWSTRKPAAVHGLKKWLLIQTDRAGGSEFMTWESQKVQRRTNVKSEAGCLCN